MKKFVFIVALAFALVSGPTNGVETSDVSLSTYHVNVEDSVMQKIADKFEVTRKLKDGYEIYVPVNQTTELLKLAPNAQLIEEDNSLSLRQLSLTQSFGPQYRKFNDVIEELQKLASDNPDLVQFVEYGKSADGRPLFAVKISDNVTVDEDEPELMITAATHGDEIITTEIVMNLIEKLVAGYGHDERLTKMVADHELYFIPVVNADGFSDRVRYDKGEDPNRSYPWPEDPSATPTASIKALIAFFHSRNFVGSLDYHAYGELTMYPWAYTYQSVSEKDRVAFDQLAKKMAETNNYTYGPISKVIYVAKGSSADYYYWKNHTLAMAVEVGSDKAPSPNQIQSYTTENTESTWRFIENF